MGKLYKRTVKNGKKNYEIRVEQYDNVSDLHHDLETRELKCGGWHDPEFSSWTGIKNKEQLKDFMLNGYQPTVQNLKEKVRISAGGMTTKRVSFRNNVQGFAPVVPLAMMNVPNNMIDVQTKKLKNKVIDVYYDMTCNSGVGSDDIIDSGEKVLGAIMELEKQGYKFNLYAVQTYSDSRDCDMLVVKIKSSDRPFDLKRMSFSLTHTGFFRVVGFDWYGKCPTSTYRCGYGHYMAAEFTEEGLKDAIKEMFGNNAIMFRAAQIVRERHSQEHIKEVLTNAGEGKN